MADDAQGAPQLPSPNQAGQQPPGFMTGLLSVVGPGMHAKQQAEVNAQTQLRNFYLDQLHKGMESGTIREGDPMYTHMMDQVNSTLGKGGKSILQKAGQFIQHFARAGQQGQPQSGQGVPAPPTAMGAPAAPVAQAKDTDQLSTPMPSVMPTATTAGGSAPPPPPSATPTSAQLTKGIPGVVPTFPTSAPPPAAGSGAGPAATAGPGAGTGNIYADTAQRMRDIETGQGKARMIAEEEARLTGHKAAQEADWQFQQTHNPEELAARHKISALESVMGPLTDTQKAQVMGLIPKNTKKGWTRDPGGKLYSVAINPMTNQPVAGTENYNDASLPPALMTKVKTGEHFYVDENNQLRAVPTSTTTAPVLPGMAAGPGAGSASASHPAAPPKPAKGAAPTPPSASGTGGSAGRVIGSVKGQLLVVPTPAGPTVVTTKPGQPLPPGAVTMQTYSSTQQPTAQIRTMAQRAAGQLELMGPLEQEIDAMDKAGKLGPVAGRWNAFLTGRVGAGDPDYTELKTKIDLLQTAMMLIHVGGRGSTPILNKFQNMLDAGKMDAPTLKAAMAGIRTQLGEYAKEGQLPGFGGTPPPPSTGGPVSPVAGHDPLGIR